MKSTLSIYCIVKRDYTGQKILSIFCEYEINNAKLWFKSFINQFKADKPYQYILFKIGELDSDLKVKGYKIYICTGASVITDTKPLHLQLREDERTKINRETIRAIRKLYEEGANMEDVVSVAFDGKKIE